MRCHFAAIHFEPLALSDLTHDIVFGQIDPLL